MTVPAIGASPTPITLPSGQPLGVSSASKQAADSVALLLGELSERQAAALFEMLDRNQLPENAAAPILPAALTLAMAGPDLAAALHHGESGVQLHSQAQISRAEELVVSEGARELLSGIKTDIALAVANRLFDAGHHAGYVRAAELATAVINVYALPPAVVFPDLPRLAIANVEDSPIGFRGVLMSAIQRMAVLRRDGTRRLRALWLRAPLLVLLLTWMAVGLAGGAVSAILRRLAPDALDASMVSIGFDVWALGFLALVGFGFFMRVRRLNRY